jgi:hypothetical protein
MKPRSGIDALKTRLRMAIRRGDRQEAKLIKAELDRVTKAEHAVKPPEETA